ECPDFFQLPIDNALSNKKWVLTAASSEYMVGVFDGKTFTPETSKLPGHRGKGFYAAQTFSNDPKARVVQIGWLQTTTPKMPFNQSMSLPMELGLRQLSDGPKLTWQPVGETFALRGKRLVHFSDWLQPASNPVSDIEVELLDIRVEFEPAEASEISFNVRGVSISYDLKKQE